LSNGQQALLFLNRRGFAPTLQCHDCGWQAQCRSCDARMTVHRRPHRLRCHHCGAAARIPANCPECHSRNLLTHGLGTEQAADILQQEFPQWPVHRVDSDTTSSREAMSQLLDEINSGAPCILLGTQMLAKGHHFPAVTLAAVIDADAMLFSTDFRGEEKMAQLLTQVGGRAGRDKTPGRVIMQSHHPDHPTLQAILEKSYMEQATDILERRQEVGLPPYGHLAVLRTDCSDADFGERFLASLRRQLEQQGPGACALVGPLPSPMHRRAGKYRSQLIITAGSRGALQQSAHLAVGIAQTLPGRRDFKWSIDVDPQDPI
jgi:primosomal protein N' (replication factor Y)